MTWLARVLTLLASGVLLGATYQVVAGWLDRAWIPGELITVDGRRSHLWCQGDGEPAVIFESGRWGSYADWRAVTGLLPKDMRHCVYDRPGLGWSDLPDRPLGSPELSGHLNRLLETAGINGELILVGHSIGGYYARKFTENYPGRVVGLVLVDATHEDAPRRMSYPPEDLSQVSLCRSFAWMGLPRLLGLMSTAVPRSAEGDFRDELMAIANRSTYCEGLLLTARAVDAELAEAGNPSPLGDLPLVVLQRARPAEAYRGLEGEGLALFQRNEPLWVEMQSELAALSTRSTLVAVAESGHGMPLDAPERIRDAILQVIAMGNGKQDP